MDNEELIQYIEISTLGEKHKTFLIIGTRIKEPIGKMFCNHNGEYVVRLNDVVCLRSEDLTKINTKIKSLNRGLEDVNNE